MWYDDAAAGRAPRTPRRVCRAGHLLCGECTRRVQLSDAEWRGACPLCRARLLREPHVVVTLREARALCASGVP